MRNILDVLHAFWHREIKFILEALKVKDDGPRLNRDQALALSTVMKKIPLLSDVPPLYLKRLAVDCRIYELEQGEIVQNIRIPQNKIIFVLSGKVLRYRETADGWLNPLNMIKSAGIVNEFVFLYGHGKVFAEVASEKALLLSIPLNKFKELMDTYGKIGIAFSNHLIKELDKYQNRWMTV